MKTKHVIELIGALAIGVGWRDELVGRVVFGVGSKVLRVGWMVEVVEPEVSGVGAKFEGVVWEVLAGVGPGGRGGGPGMGGEVETQPPLEELAGFRYPE